MDRFSLKARWVVPVEGQPISGGVVTIENGLIVAVNDNAIATGPIEDLGDVALLPGLVNAHTHLEFSDLESPLGRPGMPLPDWIRLVINERKQSSKNVAQNILKGLQESLRWGVTLIGNIATSVSHAPQDVPEILDFQEVIGFSSGRVDSAFAEALERIEKSGSAGVSPHAPYTVHPQLLDKLIDEAARRKLPMAMHLAESQQELELLEQGTGGFYELLEERSMWDDKAISRGTKPLGYLQALSRASRALVIHGNYLSDEELTFLAANSDRMSLVYCPRTHAYFEHEAYPLTKLLAAGVHVALGTDSRASNPDLSLLGEMQFVADRLRVPPEQIVRMATLSGAKALGRGNQTGSISPGKIANFTALACNSQDPCQEIVHGEDAPIGVWLQGLRC